MYIKYNYYCKLLPLQVLTQEYIEWLNEHLPENEQVDNISESLADGTLILKALSVSCFFYSQHAFHH